MQVQHAKQHANIAAANPLPGPGAIEAGTVEAAFDALIAQASFPCLGAKASRARGLLRTFAAGDITRDLDDLAITRRLQAVPEPDAASSFLSVAVLFPHSPRLDEQAFEHALWARLQAINAHDRGGYRWDTRVSDDPASPDFSMSVGGKAFYVVGLHPEASRPARRFQCPVLVFNLHSQFERLRADGRYPKLRAAILERDTAFAGSTNPMLSVHGTSSEARQYSGRAVADDWVCPFAPKPKERTA